MIKNFEKQIGYNFKDKRLLRQAFTHSSYSYENKINPLNNNERLEFLGDAVLELIISDYLYSRYTEMSEGELTKFRAFLVCEHSLASQAVKYNVGKYALLGKGEDANGGRKRDSILADIVEAIIGAVYLDGGLEIVKQIIINMFSKDIDIAYENFNTSDYKTYLQEVLQSKSKEIIQYVIVAEEGPDHDKKFTAIVQHGNVQLGEGTGKSKKEAEQNAAYCAIKKLQV